MKQRYKFIIDAIILVLFVLMFNKHAVDMTFHEFFGLIALVLMLVHLILNWKWVVQISKNCCAQKTLLKVRIEYIVNLLLIVCLVVLFVNSIAISRKIMPALGFKAHPEWIPLHFFTAAVMIILLGIHFGFHFPVIGKILTRNHPANKIVKVFISIAAVIVFVYGVDTIVTGSFGMWLKAPFQSTIDHVHDTVAHVGQELGTHGFGSGKYGFGKGLHESEFDVELFLSTLFSYLCVLLSFSIVTAGVVDFFEKKK